MITIHSCDDLSTIQDMKSAYLGSLVAPMDGMWDAGFTNDSPHWEIRSNHERAGYFAVNSEGALLQFFVTARFESQREAMFRKVIGRDDVATAEASTIDPIFLALCLDVHKSLTVHTVLYELGVHKNTNLPVERDGLDLRPVQMEELEQVVPFQRNCLDGDETLIEWLRDYSSSLIERGELFVLEREGDWLALGECRRSDTQHGIADLGMMVSPDFRRQGWGTRILILLIEYCDSIGLRPICSTTIQNTGARKAIERAGFAGRHRIMTIQF